MMNAPLNETVAVLGGGAGAHAMASDLALAGHAVRMAELPEFSGNIAATRARSGIELSGAAPSGGSPGFARLELVTTDIAEAMRGAGLVMVVVPAYGHAAFMRAILACATESQVIVFHSSYFSSLRFSTMAEALRKTGEGRSAGNLLFGETASLLYLTRMKGPGQVWIKAAKRRMPFSALPASRTQEALARLGPVFPQLVPARSVFETSLNEAGVLVHPVTTILNMSRIEREGPYQSSYYDITPGIGRVMDAVDAERQSLQEALGLPKASLPDTIFQFFGVRGANCHDAIRACPNYSSQTTPDSLRHRYLAEDVPYGLLPMAAIGARLGLDMSATLSLARIAGIATDRIYPSPAACLAELGLTGLDAARMRAVVE